MRFLNELLLLLAFATSGCTTSAVNETAKVAPTFRSPLEQVTIAAAATSRGPASETMGDASWSRVLPGGNRIRGTPANLAPVQIERPTYCSIMRANPNQEGVFDRPVGDPVEVLKNGSTGQTILIQLDGRVIENFDVKTVRSEMNKATHITVSRTNGMLVLSVGTVDFSKKDNILPIRFMSGGTLGRLSMFNDYELGISAVCFQQ